MKISSNLLKIALVAFIFTSVPSHVLCSDSVQVEYNPDTANLTVKAEDADLEGILALVSHKTGVWVRIDPSIEKRITTELNDTPLESVLRQLSRGLSNSMIYESLDNGGGLRLVGIEIVSNEVVPEQGTRSHGSADIRFLSDATRGGSFYADHSTVNNAGIGSWLNTTTEQSSDMAIAEFTPVAGEADPDENAGEKSPVDSDTEQPAYIPNEKTGFSMKGTAIVDYAGGS